MIRTKAEIVVALAISVAGSVALGVTYVVGGDAQLEGVFLAVALGGIGWAVVAAAHRLLDEGPAVEERHDLGSPPERRDEVEADLLAPATRRGFLIGAFGTALGALGLAALFPVASLGRSRAAAASSVWRDGIRLVDEAGRPVGRDALPVGGALTVFPEGRMEEADAVVMLVRMNPGTTDPASAPEGYLAYSKICTHAGCPVGLFDGETGILTCPCHQSAFQTLEDAEPIAGPAARPLPKLPIRVDAAGDLVAAGPMSRPIGPGYWEQPKA
jgi:ubiquinol-cytochrome c reductase iron-sulfur subunit